MSDIITVENLGKKYLLRHQRDQRPYATLRDVIAKKASLLGQRILAPFRSPRQSAQEEFWALKDISFRVKQGERIGIIGRNGAGKSTFLKILSRIVEPTTGEVRIRGRVASLLEVGTGFHPELTGRENIFLNGAILGMSRTEIKRKFDEIVDFAEIERFLDTPVKRYSSGMYVRLAFAVAAHLEPEILIVDEVLAVGDAQFQKKCLGKMEQAGKEGRTVLFVSHNMTAINALCSRVIVVEQGEISRDGDCSQCVKHYLEMSRITARATIDVDDREALPISIRHASVCDKDSNIVSTLDYHNQYYLYINITIRDSDRDYYATVAVHDDLGNLIIFTADDDFLESKLSGAKGGEHLFKVSLPSRLLKPGDYTLVITLNKRMQGPSVQISKAALSVEIQDNASRRALKKAYRPSMVAPEVIWEYIDGSSREHENITCDL